MNTYIFTDPHFRPLDLAGARMPLAVLKFFVTTTLVPTPVYADADLSTPLGTEITADGDGTCDVMYMDPEVTYRVQLYNAAGALQWDVDPYTPPRDFAPRTVVMYFGTAVQRDVAYPPDLWQVCNGDNASPDMRDRFPVAAGGSFDAGDTGGTDGGTLTTTENGAIVAGTTGDTVLTADMVPAPALEVFVWKTGGQGNAENFTVAHGVAGDNDHSYPGSYGYQQQTVDGNDIVRATGGGSEPHNHSVPEIPDHTHDVDVGLPPYLALWFLMRRT